MNVCMYCSWQRYAFYATLRAAHRYSAKIADIIVFRLSTNAPPQISRYLVVLMITISMTGRFSTVDVINVTQHKYLGRVPLYTAGGRDADRNFSNEITYYLLKIDTRIFYKIKNRITPNKW